MRTVALLPALLIAASASAQTYTNNFTGDNPVPTLTTSTTFYQWDLSQPYAAQKPWNTASTEGNFSVSGQATVTDAYATQYPGAANAGGADFQLEITFKDSPTFKVSDINTLAIQYSLGNLHTSGSGISVKLLTALDNPFSGYYLQYGVGNPSANVSVSSTTANGVTLLTFTDFTADAQDRTFVGIGIQGQIIYGGPVPAKNQYFDYNFKSVSINPSAVPEPSTYGLMLGGLALVGAAVVRRRKALK